MLRQLPDKTEVPNLLVDISQTGLGAGLEEKLFQPAARSSKDFYAELPIRIRLTGGYHEMGEFVSGIAALPRIVTLHDIEITPASERNRGRSTRRPVLNVTAKTYRYLDEDEQAARPQPAKAAAKRKKQDAAERQQDRGFEAHEHIASASSLVAVVAARALAGCSSDLDDLQAQHRRGQEPARAAASSRCRRSSRTRPSTTSGDLRSPFVPGHAGASHGAGRAAPDLQPPARVPRAVLARHAAHGRHAAAAAAAPTAWSRPRTASCIACCPATTSARATAGSRPSSDAKISLVEIVPDGLGGYIERPAALALDE